MTWLPICGFIPKSHILLLFATFLFQANVILFWLLYLWVTFWSHTSCHLQLCSYSGLFWILPNGLSFVIFFFFSSLKKVIGVWMALTLNLSAVVGHMEIFQIVTLRIHEHGMFSHWLCVPSIHFITLCFLIKLCHLLHWICCDIFYFVTAVNCIGFSQQVCYFCI